MTVWSKRQETHEQVRSERIDRLLTHKYLGIPIFFLIMFLIFWLTFSVIGAPLQDLLGTGIDWCTAQLAGLLEQCWSSGMAAISIN